VSVCTDIVAQPSVLGSIFRIDRDTRFSKDKTACKNHLDLWFWEGERCQAVSGFFVRSTPDFVGIGAGSHGFDKHRLEYFRCALGAEPSGLKLAGIVKALGNGGYQLVSTHVRAPLERICVVASLVDRARAQCLSGMRVEGTAIAYSQQTGGESPYSGVF